MSSTLALIALGSNLGDRSATIDHAIAELSTTPEVRVRAVSSYHETAPVGGPGGQGAFLNAAAALETTLDPFALHQRLLDIERQAGRVREIRWDARTLDLDLILFGNQIIDSRSLTIPHPRMAVRRFVLAPLSEIAPEAVDPITHRTVLELLLQLDRRPSYLAIDRTIDPELARAVALDVADRLDARTLLGSPEDFPAGRRDATVLEDAEQYQFTRDDLDRIEAASRSLSSERDRAWKSGSLSWLVSDYQLPRELQRTLSVVYPNSEPPDHPVTMAGNPRQLFIRVAEVAASIRSSPIPTITVMLGGNRSDSNLTDFESGATLFMPDRADRNRIVAEVLAACEASRAGFGTS